MFVKQKINFNRFVLQECGILLGGCLTVKNLWCHLRKHLGRNAINYFMYQWVPPDSPYPPHSSSSGSSCISTKPVYSTSSVTWLMLRPVRSDMEMAKKWHKWRLIEIWNYVSNWYCWRTRHDSNVWPSVPQTLIVGIQGQTATNKGNNISK